MKRHLIHMAAMGVAGFFLMSAPAHSENTQLSPERLNVLDRRGYFTPAFKATVHDLVDIHQTLEQAKDERMKLKDSLPDMQKQSSDAEAKAASLRQELSKYDHTDETDFTALQSRMNDPKAKPEDQLAQAQAYVWAYPADPHQAQAQQYLQQVQKKIADQVQAEKDNAAARAAARAALVQRVQAKDLKLTEWNDFLRDMSQEDVLKYLGRPSSYGQDYWLYTGAWTVDPYTGQKVGIQVSFNGTRVNGVSSGPPAP